jgi:hypothetical protein
MDDVPMVTHFMGQNVDDMTRGETINAVKILGQLVENMRREAADDRDMYRQIRSFRGMLPSLP